MTSQNSQKHTTKSNVDFGLKSVYYLLYFIAVFSDGDQTRQYLSPNTANEKKIQDEIGLNIGSYFVLYFFFICCIWRRILSRLVAIAKSVEDRIKSAVRCNRGTYFMSGQIEGPALFYLWISDKYRDRRLEIGQFSLFFAIGSPRQMKNTPMKYSD